MASLNMFVAPIATLQTQRRFRTAATAAKSSAGPAEEKNILDFILGSLTKQEQIYETNPILKKVEEKSSTGTTGRSRTSSVVAPPKKKEGGFNLGGLFLKKE